MTEYKKGMQFTCPHCGQDSVVTLETEMDGWTKVGESLRCAMCRARLLDVVEERSHDDVPVKDETGKTDLLDFLGTNERVRDELIDDDGLRRFCKNCTHLLEHPFKVFCLLHKKTVNPMDDCSEFDRKES